MAAAKRHAFLRLTPLVLGAILVLDASYPSPGRSETVTEIKKRSRDMELEMVIPTHRLSSKNPNGCKICHGGLGYIGRLEEKLCYVCHGRLKRIENPKPAAVAVAASDVKKEFEKPHRHPVERFSLYQAKQEYPVRIATKPRYAECLDCHDPHRSIPGSPIAGVSGLGIDGRTVKHADEEYQVCFKCHGPSLNKPTNQKDKIREFRTDNPSYHPVVAPGKNNTLPSLVREYTYESTITCSTCHGSDERSLGHLKGPHGSENEYILVRPYNKREDSLSMKFDLCYKCHREDSILANESFKFHREHILGVKTRAWKGTSCSTCHTPHGSVKYRFLIDFNPDYVTKSTSLQKIEFTSDGLYQGSCTLTCHDVDHAHRRYGLTSPQKPAQDSSVKSGTR